MTFGSEPRLNLAFSGITTFLRAPICSDLEQLDADMAILGIPFDEGTTWMPGSRLGPRRIREMAMRFASQGASAGYFDLDDSKRYLQARDGVRADRRLRRRRYPVDQSRGDVRQRHPCGEGDPGAWRHADCHWR